jgi:hypothetical protein
MTCPDLQDYAHQYQIRRDPAVSARNNDPWTKTIPTRTGEIYSHGPDTLAVEVIGHAKIANRVAQLPGVRLHQDGDGEKTFLFHPNLIHRVAQIVRPYRPHRTHVNSLANLIPGGLVASPFGA